MGPFLFMAFSQNFFSNYDGCVNMEHNNKFEVDGGIYEYSK